MSSHSILVIEDNRIQSKILASQLAKAGYELEVVHSGEEAEVVLVSRLFDLVILDVHLPGISGYDFCRKLKADDRLAGIPVMFVSGGTSMDERLEGFDAGGYDYLSKPLIFPELMSKIEVLFDSSSAKSALKEQLSFANTVAMAAMTNAAEQGVVIEFMRNSFSCETYGDLGRTIIQSISGFGLDASVMVAGEFQSEIVCSSGTCTPMEKGILENMAKNGSRVVDFGTRTAICYQRITVVLKNMPREDAERYGRLKDHLNMLAEGACARVKAIDANMRLGIERQQMLNKTVEVGQQLVEVSRESQALQIGFGRVFSEVTAEIEQIIPLLEVNHSKESLLEDMIDRMSQAYAGISEQERALNSVLTKAVQALGMR